MTTNKDWVVKRASSHSFKLSSNDQRPENNHLASETALFFYFYSDVLLWASRGPAAWGNHAAVCGAELKGFTLHHFKPHFQPPYCCLRAAGDGSSFINYISSLRRLLGNLEDSDMILFFGFISDWNWKKNDCVLEELSVIPLYLNKGKMHLFFCIWSQHR